jgi:hypothetical protein
MRPTKDLVDRMCAGQRPATGAPPGTRTPNPRIKSPNAAVCRRGPARAGWCRFRSSTTSRCAVACRVVPASPTATEHRSSTATPSRCSICGRVGERRRHQASGLLIRGFRGDDASAVSPHHPCPTARSGREITAGRVKLCRAPPPSARRGTSNGRHPLTHMPMSGCRYLARALPSTLCDPRDGPASRHASTKSNAALSLGA